MNSPCMFHLSPFRQPDAWALWQERHDASSLVPGPPFAATTVPELSARGARTVTLLLFVMKGTRERYAVALVPVMLPEATYAL